MTESDGSLSHVASDGTARMVDVTAKATTSRMARASGRIVMQAATLEAIMRNEVAKGDVLGVARLAGVMAAKRTADLIPLCHPLPLTSISVSLIPDPELPGVRVEAVVKTIGKTGVEMEALTAVSLALLAVYDMVKAIDRGMTMGEVSLLEKTGGAGGNYASLDGTSSAI